MVLDVESKNTVSWVLTESSSHGKFFATISIEQYTQSRRVSRLKTRSLLQLALIYKCKHVRCTDGFLFGFFAIGWANAFSCLASGPKFAIDSLTQIWRYLCYDWDLLITEELTAVALVCHHDELFLLARRNTKLAFVFIGHTVCSTDGPFQELKKQTLLTIIRALTGNIWTGSEYKYRISINSNVPKIYIVQLTRRPLRHVASPVLNWKLLLRYLIWLL